MTRATILYRRAFRRVSSDIPHHHSPQQTTNSSSFNPQTTLTMNLLLNRSAKFSISSYLAISFNRFFKNFIFLQLPTFHGLRSLIYLHGKKLLVLPRKFQFFSPIILVTILPVIIFCIMHKHIHSHNCHISLY